MRKLLPAIAILLAGAMAAWAGSAAWHVNYYSNSAITVDPNGDSVSSSSITAFASSVSGTFASTPWHAVGFRLVGAANDPNFPVTTADLTMKLYADPNGVGGALCTITFDQLDPNVTTDIEFWPGDCTAFDPEAIYGSPLPPYFDINWTIDIDPNTSDPNSFIFSVDFYGDFMRYD